MANFLDNELISDVIANRPTTFSKGRRFYSMDERIEYYDDGSVWQPMAFAESQITNLSTDLTLRAEIDSIQQEAYTAADDTGAANAYAVTLVPVPALVEYSLVVFKAAHANTGASTLAVNGGSAIPIKKSGTLALASGDILAGQIITVIYDGTNFQLMGALRALVAADIPAIAESGVTGLVSDLAAKVPTSRTISTTAPLTGGGALSTDLTLAIDAFTGDTGTGGLKGAVPAPASGDAAAGKFLKADGTFAVPAGATSGTVTSVALTVPSRQSVSGSPITSSGTLAVTDNTQTANTVFAGPASGSAAAPTFRTPVELDLPVPSFATLTDSGAVTWDTANKRIVNATLTMVHTTATRSLTLTNLAAGASGTLIVKQDSTGGAALTFGVSPVSKVINGGAGAVTITPAASAIDVLSWMYDGTNLFWTAGPNYS